MKIIQRDVQQFGEPECHNGKCVAGKIKRDTNRFGMEDEWLCKIGTEINAGHQ